MSWKWNILELDDDYEWAHKQILHRLHDKDIDCYFVDMWSDDIAYIIGIKSSDEEVARALGVHRESIYHDFEHCFMIINLFQEKYLRGLLKNDMDD